MNYATLMAIFTEHLLPLILQEPHGSDLFTLRILH